MVFYLFSRDDLLSDREEWGDWLLHTLGDAADRDVDQDGQQSGEQRGECVVHASVLVNLDDLVNDPTDEVHPREGAREGETGDNRVQRLGFELLGDKGNGFGGSRHFYIILLENYSGRSSSISNNFLYVFLSPDIFFPFTWGSSDSLSDSSSEESSHALNFLYLSSTHPSGELDLDSSDTAQGAPISNSPSDSESEQSITVNGIF